MREHFMCVRCQREWRGDVGLTPCTSQGIRFSWCCWCGKKRTQRLAPPELELPCEDVHLEDVS